MRNLRITAMAFLALAGFAAAAMADVQVDASAAGPGDVPPSELYIKHRSTIPGDAPSATVITRNHIIGASVKVVITIARQGNVVPANRVYTTGGVDFTTSPITILSGVVAIGNSSGGDVYDNGTEAVPDSNVAGVGFYTPGNQGTAAGSGASPSNGDSLCAVQVSGSGGQVTLNILRGGLFARSTGDHLGGARLKMIVYPNQAAADADSTARTGAGASGMGTIMLTGASGQTSASGFFTPSDFFVVNEGVGKYTLRFKPGLTKVVNVPDAAQAVFIPVPDPISTDEVPGQSSLGLLVLALVLAGAGVWVLRQRRVAAAA